MQKLIFINGAGTQIDLTSGNFGVTNWAGLSNTSLNIQTQQVPFEDGGVFLDALMEQREIELTVAIYDGNNLALRYQKKRELISVLNPKLGEGLLIYTNDYLSRQIHAVPQIPLFENKNSNDAGTLKASIVFSCPSPYWEDIEESEIEINDTTVTKIVNNGDVDIGIDAKIEPVLSNGTVINPFIFNITQNKKIEYIGQIKKDPLLINTIVGQKKVYKDALNPESMKYAYVGTLGNNEIIYSEYYRKYYCITGTSVNYTIKSSTNGIDWINVTTVDYNKLYIYSNIVILYKDSSFDEVKLKISLDFINFTEYTIQIGDRMDIFKLVCFQPDIQVQQFELCIDCGETYFSTFTISENIIINFNTNFVLKNLNIGNSLLLIYNENKKALFAVTGYDCYKYNNSQWEKISVNNIYPYLPKGKYIKESNLMVCYGTQYGYIYWSYDGIYWENTEISAFKDLRDITYDAEKHRYLAVGIYDYPSKPLLAESKDMIHWEILKGLESLEISNISQILTNGNGIYVMHIFIDGQEYNIAVSDLQMYQNEISNLTSESNMTLGLSKGDNRIIISDKTKCKIKYRQKYIGV